MKSNNGCRMKDDFRECCRLRRRGFLGCEVARAAEPTRVAIAVTLSMGSLSKRSCVRSHRHRVRAFIPPRVPGTILDDDIALFEMNGFSIIQFKPYFPFEDDGIIHRICFMHPWIFLLEMISKSPQTIQGFAMGGLSIKRWGGEDRS